MTLKNYWPRLYRKCMPHLHAAQPFFSGRTGIPRWDLHMLHELLDRFAFNCRASRGKSYLIIRYDPLIGWLREKRVSYQPNDVAHHWGTADLLQ